MRYKQIKRVTIVALILLFGVYFCHTTDEDICFEQGLIWDFNENRCRKDCLSWVENKGCIRLDVLSEITYEVCGGSLSECTSEQKKEDAIRSCLIYKGAVNLNTNNCDYGFQLKECGKLKGNWLYPKECNLSSEMTF